MQWLFVVPCKSCGRQIMLLRSGAKHPFFDVKSAPLRDLVCTPCGHRDDYQASDVQRMAD